MNNAGGQERGEQVWQERGQEDFRRAELDQMNSEAAAEQAAMQIQMANEAARRLGQIGVQQGETVGVLTSAAELEQDERELERAQEFVGEGSEITELGRLAEDQEDLARELKQGVKSEYKIVDRSVKETAEMVTAEVDRLLGQKVFEVADLAQKYNEWNQEMLGRAYQRKIGGRN